MEYAVSCVKMTHVRNCTNFYIGSLCAGHTHALLYISVVIEFNLLRIPVGWALVVRNALVVCTTGSVDAALLKKEQNS